MECILCDNRIQQTKMKARIRKMAGDLHGFSGTVEMIWHRIYLKDQENWGAGYGRKMYT